MMATFDDIRKGIEAIKTAGGEPLRDTFVFVFPEAHDEIGIPKGYVLRLERHDDGLWHEVAKTKDDGERWNNTAFAFKDTPQG